MTLNGTGHYLCTHASAVSSRMHACCVVHLGACMMLHHDPEPPAVHACKHASHVCMLTLHDPKPGGTCMPMLLLLLLLMRTCVRRRACVVGCVTDTILTS
jgi:hypothetical protein